MSKIYFIPDIHLQEQSPRSRKDSYPTTILEKLEYIVEYVNNNNGTAIFLGDVFNAVNLPMNYLYRCIDTFRKFKNKPFVIFGNHDLSRNNPELKDRTPLGLLINAGFVEELHHYEVEGKVVIDGFSYTDSILPAAQLTSTIKPMRRICVAHCFFEDSFAETHNLKIEDCVNLGYDTYILGHLHDQMEDYHNKYYTVYRIGSLSRGTANESQLTRDKVFILEYDTITDIFTRISIPCLPAKEVFKDSVFLRKEEMNMDKILDNLVFTSNDSIYDILDKSEQSKEVKDKVEMYLQSSGIYREDIKNVNLTNSQEEQTSI